jgi:tetratricopeptide (TPR) repeat protein
MKRSLVAAWLCLSPSLWPADLDGARDRQDRPALEAAVRELAEAARKSPGDARGHYRLALAQSYLSEVALELRDKQLARSAAEEGIRAAERAVALDAKTAEHHRILGTLCGQVIPANVLSGLKYGRCAQEAIDKAIALDPKSALAYLSRGIGSFYLPEAFGGGVEPAVRDFRKTIELNPKSAEGYLWLGLALRKAKRNTEARKAIERALELNPKRVWTKQQLEKTPAR